MKQVQRPGTTQLQEKVLSQQDSGVGVPIFTSDGAGSAEAISQSGDLVKSMTELIRIQMKAMTDAPSVLSLPPIKCYTGEGSQEEEYGIDRWLERFDERAHASTSWTDEMKLYQLKLHLKWNALLTFRMFTKEEQSSPATPKLQTPFVRGSVQSNFTRKSGK